MTELTAHVQTGIQEIYKERMHRWHRNHLYKWYPIPHRDISEQGL